MRLTEESKPRVSTHCDFLMNEILIQNKQNSVKFVREILCYSATPSPALDFLVKV